MTFTAFLEREVVARGTEAEIAPVLRDLPPLAAASDLLVFDDESGRQVDLDLRDKAEVPRGRGRPALGVTAREITLLPRHWDWLARQRGGASATLRKLVEAEMRKGRTPRECQDAAYWFLSTIAGDLPRFEDAVRELYLGNKVGYDHFTHGWPAAIRDHGRCLAWPG
ncbi:MAG TPA: DUF2239 family protein [Paracoccaceae bacterium]|nr:DUF2239 family protein [Paracoccaceae bacterium]